MNTKLPDDTLPQLPYPGKLRVECDDGYEDSTGALFYVTQCDSSGAWTIIRSCTGKQIEDDSLHSYRIDYGYQHEI